MIFVEFFRRSINENVYNPIPELDWSKPCPIRALALNTYTESPTPVDALWAL